MAEPNEKELDLEEEEIEEPEPVIDETSGEDTTDWKTESSKGFGIANRYKTKFGKLKESFETYKKEHPETSKEEPKQPQDKKEFDLAEKSYLLSNGIKKEEFKDVFDEVQKTGKTIDEVLELSLIHI